MFPDRLPKAVDNPTDEQPREPVPPRTAKRAHRLAEDRMHRPAEDR